MPYPRERAWQAVDVSTEPDCLLCGGTVKSAYG